MAADKGENTKQSIPLWITIVTIATPILLGAITLWDNREIASIKSTTEKEIESIKSMTKEDIKDKDIEMQRLRLDEEVKSRKEKIIIANVPKLVSINVSDNRAAVAILFALDPNGAKEILSRVSESLTVTQKKALQ